MSELPMTTCCGGTGYADYAAVPCPAPSCLAAAELIRRGPTSIGLSYANYLVLPRTLLQSMPAGWQLRMVACLNELDEAFDHIPRAEAYEVTAGEQYSLVDLSDLQLKYLGYSREDDEDEEVAVRYYDRDGNEIDHPDCYRVVWPTGDPVPHYNRGRTRIEPGASREHRGERPREDQEP